jgi:sRNA-binding regulator protein Hfq
MAMTVTLAELEALAADPAVVSIHEDGQVQAGLQDSVPLIGMPAAYGNGATGNNTMVAIVDTGVEYGHVFTTPRVTHAHCFSTTNATFTTLCPNGQPSQIGGTAGLNCGLPGCEHGTHVAGIAAGNRASGTPLNGVAKNARIFAAQVFSRRNADNAVVSFDSDMLASLNDLLGRVNSGELVNLASINMSIWDAGMEVAGNCDAVARGVPFKNVIDALRAQRVATVIISGNGSKTNLSAFPGCISTAVTVSSTTKSDTVSSFSNLSPIVDLFAPGSNITSSVPPTPNFSVLSGTSMAAPHVAGAFAAIRSACQSVTPDAIENALKSTGTPVADGRAGGTITKPRIRVDLAVIQACNLAPPPPVASCTLASYLGDFNGDGRSDLMFRRTDGLISQYLMNGFQFIAINILGAVGTDRRLVAVADFNGDGRADMLFRRVTDGMLSLYLLNGPQILGAQELGAIGTDWDLAGVADFNGDGRADMLFRRKNDGMLSLYLMNGFQILQAQLLGAVGNDFRVRGVADFNGDGRADILFRRESDGMVSLYLFNGFQMLGAQVLGAVGADFRLLGVGDFNGDGRADMLFRRTSDGMLSLYLLNGFQLLGAQLLGAVGTNFSLLGIGDLNGDGRADTLFRRNDGLLTAYLWNGFQLIGAQALGTIGLDWTACYGQPPLSVAQAGGE